MAEFFNIIESNQIEIILILSIVLLLLSFLTVYLFFESLKAKKRNQVFFAGKNAKNLEEIILRQIQKSKDLEEAIIYLKNTDQKILDQLSFAVQKVGVVRFNPFGDVGGNQSFAVALLDNHDSGVMILSLYSRGGVRIYGKAIQDGKSEYKLSGEEEEALHKAMGR